MSIIVGLTELNFYIGTRDGKLIQILVKNGCGSSVDSSVTEIIIRING